MAIMKRVRSCGELIYRDTCEQILAEEQIVTKNIQSYMRFGGMIQ